MDKYEYGLKTEKIQKLVREKDYETAAQIADTMEWAQERNVRLLNAAAIAYEMTGKNAEAIDLLLRAYERSSAGKRILYKLTELALAAGNVKDAETFYKKYLEEADGENDRYLLRYQIAEAKGEALDRKIAILEAYQRQEFEEQWACRLAELYQEAGQQEKCVKLCDEIILWFSVGPYVERAMDLKETFVPLTSDQQDRRDNKEFYEAQIQKVAEEMEIENAARIAKPAAPEEEAPEAPASEETAEEAPAEEPATEAPAETSEETPAEAPAAEEAVPAEEPAATAEETKGESEDHMSNYTASVDSSLIQELMEEEMRETDTAEGAAPAASAAEKMDLTSEISIPVEFLKKLSEEDGEEAPEEEEIQVETVPAEAAPEEGPEEVPAPAAGFAHEHIIFLGITGDEEDEPIDCAVDALDDYYTELDQEMSPLAKITAGKLNQRGLIRSLSHLKKKDLIVDGAGDLSDDLLNQILDVVRSIDTSKVFVLMDSEDVIPGLKQRLAALAGDLVEEEPVFVPEIKVSENFDEAEEEAASEEEPEEFVIGEESEEEEEDASEEETEEEVEDDAEEEEEPDEEEADDEDDLDEEDDLEDDRVDKKAAKKAKKEAKKAAKAKKSAKPQKKAEAKDALKKAFEGIRPEQELSEKDFIRYAEYFAGELECSIDDSGYDALEDEMAEILEDNGNLTAGDVEDILEEAADNAEKMSLGRLFSSKYDKDGYLILRKKNFR